MDHVVGRRGTRASSTMALAEWRSRAPGLLLSGLGAYICDPAHAPTHQLSVRHAGSPLDQAPWGVCDGQPKALIRRAVDMPSEAGILPQVAQFTPTRSKMGLFEVDVIILRNPNDAVQHVS